MFNVEKCGRLKWKKVHNIFKALFDNYHLSYDCLRDFLLKMRIKTIAKYWVSGFFSFKTSLPAYYTLNCTISAFNGTLVQKFQKETRFKQWCPISLGDVHAHCFLYCSHLFVWTVHTFWASIRFFFFLGFFSLQFSFCKFRAKLSTHFR